MNEKNLVDCFILSLKFTNFCFVFGYLCVHVYVCVYGVVVNIRFIKSKIRFIQSKTLSLSKRK